MWPRRCRGPFEYVFPLSNTIDAGLVSGMILALAAADTPTVKAGLKNELANNAAVTQKTRNTTISGIPVQKFTMTISSSPGASVELDLSDFGMFSMATRVRTERQSSTASFEIRDVQLR